ncbi:MAG TPA: HD domain-containing phosphohydrolase [Candidatus Methylomirabilis sp.]|nr:HD domain-containing phosphohydrolase [Candidatus Methylomirabilis sp.]
MEPHAARLLVVDDVEGIRQTLKGSLQLHGYDVVSAASGDEALELLRSQRFDLLLTDHAMPGLTGIELAETMARIHPDMPVVLLTGHNDVELARASLLRGASDFVTKPFNIRDLPILIERNLTRHRLEATRLKEREAQVLFEAIKALASAVDAKDRYTARHSKRVTQLSLTLADAIGMSRDEKYVLELAAWMHDVGKIGVPDRILSKPSSLTEEEIGVMRNHPAKGGEIVGQIEEMIGVSAVIRHHHERPDGHGYPDGLRGQAIPLASRIILIADAFEAMTSNRSYRPDRGRDRAFEELRQHGGSQFDPDLVETFIAKVESLPTM